jgi:hypothetical protein
MLTAYLNATANLLQNPAAPNPLYSTASLTTYINTARGQLAGEGQCIRFLGQIPTVIGQRQYFSGAITGLGTSVAGALAVRGLWNGGNIWVQPETWEEYSLFDLTSTAVGPPQRWAQYGSGTSAAIFIAPVPDAIYNLEVDCVCYPIPLVDDTTAEAIPYLWTDAVPYYAAYLALLSAQTGARTAEADKMFERYQEFVVRARIGTTPGVLPWQLPQVPVPGGINAPPAAPGRAA